MQVRPVRGFHFPSGGAAADAADLRAGPVIILPAALQAALSQPIVYASTAEQFAVKPKVPAHGYLNISERLRPAPAARAVPRLQDLGGVISQTRAFAALQCDVTGMGPALKRSTT